MKRLGIACGLLAAVALGFAAATPFQKDTRKDAETAAQEAMEKWKAFSTPGSEQAWLANRAGTWDLEVTQFEVGQEPVKSKSVSATSMILGGRFLYDYVSGSTPWGPFEGSGVIGFDNGRKVFVSSWVDTMGTGIMNGVGTRSRDEKTLNWKLTMTDPMTNAPIELRQVDKFIGNDKVVTIMYGPGPDGGEVKAAELVYTRVKK